MNEIVLEARVFAIYWKMTRNLWQNLQRRYVLTVRLARTNSVGPVARGKQAVLWQY